MSHPLETQKRFIHKGFKNALTVLTFAISYSLPIWSSISLPFLLKLPQFQCASDSSSFTPCSKQKYCSQLGQAPHLTQANYQFFNYISDYNLECEPPSTHASFGSYLFIGYLLSALLCTLQSQYGSFKLAQFSLILHIASLSACLFVRSHTVLAILHLFIGLRATALMQFSYARLIDYINPNKAKTYASYMASFEGVASFLVSTYFLFFQHWEMLVLIQIMIGVFLYLVNFFFMTDPPIWLYSKGRYDESRKALLKTAKLFGENLKLLQESHASQAKQLIQEKPISQNQETSNITGKTVVMVLCFFLINLVFYGKSMAIKQIKANINLLAILDGFMGTLGHLISSSLTFLSESGTVMFMGIVCATACFFMQLVQFMEMSRFLELILMSSISLTAPVIYNFLNIIFFKIYRIEERPLPTLLTNLIGKVGAFAAVYLVEFLPHYIFLSFGAIAVSLVGLSDKLRVMLPKEKQD